MMEIRQEKLKVSRTAVVYETKNIQEARYHWFVCHGYGQLADNIIRKFDGLASKGHYIASVEAMNRFYWQGVTGQPVATWMTKRYRLDEIQDNNSYLSEAYRRLHPEAVRILLGFSQGGTTMWRWIHEKRPDFDIFINYAGWMPEDIDLSILGDYLKGKKLIFTYGEKDQYLTADRIKAFEQVLYRSGLEVEVIKTTGEHKIDRIVLEEICSKYL